MSVAVVPATTTMNQIVQLLTPLAQKGIDALPLALQQMAIYEAKCAMMGMQLFGALAVVFLLVVAYSAYSLYKWHQVEHSYYAEPGWQYVCITVGTVLCLMSMIVFIGDYSHYLKYTETPAFAALDYLRKFM